MSWDPTIVPRGFLLVATGHPKRVVVVPPVGHRQSNNTNTVPREDDNDTIQPVPGIIQSEGGEVCRKEARMVWVGYWPEFDDASWNYQCL